jgi:AbrB family looped-hinge helix DNA binding protein
MGNGADLVKMSGKGQLVVPEDIRESMSLSPGERFVAFAVQDGVLFKKVDIPKVKLDFNALAKEVEAQFKKNKVKNADVPGAVRWARKR